MPIIFHHSALESVAVRCDIIDVPLFDALLQLKACGVSKVLSTGREADVMAGRTVLAQMVQASLSGQAPLVTAATGINGSNVRDLIAATSVPAVHASKAAEVCAALGRARRPEPSAFAFRPRPRSSL
jgi:copper homeostasis protein CutC